MLPILRLIPVGGVFLAIAILLLALNPPQGTSPSARVGLQPARGALLDRTEHPEWRQFLIQAALRRADEIERLRELHDTVTRTEIPPAPKTAANAPAIARATIGAPFVVAPEVSGPKIAEPEATEPKIADASPVEGAPDVTEPSPVEAKPGTAAPKVTEAPSAEVKLDTAEAAPVDTRADVTEPAAAAPTIVAEPKPAADEPKVVAVAPVATEPRMAEGAPIEPKPETIATRPTAAEPKVAAATPVAAEPRATEVAPVEPKPEAFTTSPAAAEPKVAAAMPIAIAPATTVPAPFTVKPENEAQAPMQIASIVPPPPLNVKSSMTAAAPTSPGATAPIFRLETNGIRIRTETTMPVVAPATKPPVDVKVAVVPAQPVQHDDDITGSIEPDVSGTTIPVGIGEASSTELQVTLPRERPPVLLRLDRRARESKVERVQRRVHHATRARTRKAYRADVPPEFDFFTLLFKAFAGDLRPTRFKPPKIPYQPNHNWKTQQ